VTGLFDHDCVSLNGQTEINPGQNLAVGDQVSVRFEQDRRYSPRRRPEQQKHRGFTIVYEDADLIVVDKSAELLTVPTDGREPSTLIYRVNEHVRRTSRERGAILIHRLDRGVSGLLVFAKRQNAANALQTQFAEHKPDRVYLAIVSGVLEKTAGTFRSYLTTGKNLTRFSTRDLNEGELAVTHYQVLDASEDPDPTNQVSLVEVRLETGRRNQIRVHFAEAGHTVIGDARYRPDQWKAIHWPHKRLALHAFTLSFLHPTGGHLLSFQSPIPTEMSRLMKQSGLKLKM
jgi:23S rRNA pseudouridine1911/1915/1917 synthase